MADTISRTITNGNTSTTNTHNSGDDVTYMLRNETGQAVMLQTGQGTVTIATAGTAVTATVTFPTKFAKSVTSVVCSVAGSSGGSAGYVNAYADPTSWTTSQFTVTGNAYAAGTVKFTWVAIGI